MRQAALSRGWNVVRLVLLAILCFLVLNAAILRQSWASGGLKIFLVALWVLVPLALIVFWMNQFIDLMCSPEARFVTRWDKPIWAAVFILLFPLAPFLFWCWKVAMKADE